MVKVKYLYKQNNGEVFRVRVEYGGDDSILGPYLSYEIQAPEKVPHNWLDALIQLFKVPVYYSGKWFICYGEDDSFEDTILEAIKFVQKEKEYCRKARQVWKAL